MWINLFHYNYFISNMFWNFKPSSIIIRATFIYKFIALKYVQTCLVPPALVGNLEKPIHEEPLSGLFWREKYVIFEFADSIYIYGTEYSYVIYPWMQYSYILKGPWCVCASPPSSALVGSALLKKKKLNPLKLMMVKAFTGIAASFT